METGHIRKIILEKRFGFLNSKGKEYFFHAQDCPEGNFDEMYVLYQKDEVNVSFTPDKTEKGLRARNVVINYETKN